MYSDSIKIWQQLVHTCNDVSSWKLIDLSSVPKPISYLYCLTISNRYPRVRGGAQTDGCTYALARSRMFYLQVFFKPLINRYRTGYGYLYYYLKRSQFWIEIVSDTDVFRIFMDDRIHGPWFECMTMQICVAVSILCLRHHLLCCHFYFLKL